MIEIEMEPCKLTPTRTMYKTSFKGGEEILRHWDPESNTARELVKRGYTGPVTFTMKGAAGGTLYRDIEKLAGLMVEEGPTVGPRWVKYRPRTVEE